MEFRLGLPQLPVILAFFISLAVFLLSLSRLRQRGILWLIHLLGALTIWSGAYLLEISSSTLGSILFFSNLTFVGIALVPVYYLMFALSFTGETDKLRVGPLIAGLLVIPVLVQAFVWIPVLRPYFLTEYDLHLVSNLIFLTHTHGPFFWVHTAYSYLLLIGGTILLLRRVLSGRESSVGRIAAIVAACLIPLAGNILHLSGLTGEFRFIDITPISFSFSGALLLFALLRYQVDDYIPVTHQLILDNLKEGIVVIDHENRLVELNASAERLFRHPPGELIGRPLIDLAAENRELLKRYIDVFDAAGEIDLFIRGAKRPFEFSISPIKDRRLPSPGRVIVMRDITERRHSEIQASKAERLDSMELLAGGVAHDFNNLLSAIAGNLSLADAENRDPIVADFLQQAQSASGQAARLTRQLLSFSSKGCPEAEPSSLNELVVETVGFFLRGSNVASRVEIDDDLWNLYVDPQQIVQVLNNLVVNTKQALVDGGTLTVTAENRDMVDGNWLKLDAGRYVHVVLKDDGPGIDPEVLPRIFDPYYTTKQEGSGLGLAVAHGIVRNNNGVLYAEPGAGACFHLYLPAIRKADLPAIEETDQGISLEEMRVDGVRHLVLMDDDRDVRLVVGRILNRMGYRVELFSDAGQVLRYLQNGGRNQIQAIIADLTVPGGGGACELEEGLRRSGVKLPIIVASGYPEKPAVREYRAYGFCAAIEKPFTPQKVHAALLATQD